MSKTAVLISGQMRTFATCLPSLYWTVFRKLKDPHFFVSAAKDDQATTAYLLENYPEFKGKVFIEIVEQPTLPEPHIRYAAHAPYAISAPVQSILRQLWAYNRVWEFFCETARSHIVEVSNPPMLALTNSIPDFSTVVRCRPDLFFHRFDPVRHLEPHEFMGVWKARCGGVNDRFAVMGRGAAKAYFTAFTKLQSLLDAGCPLHPESIQQAAMEQDGVGIRNTLTCEFTAVRLDGKTAPLLEYPGEMAQFIQSTG